MNFRGTSFPGTLTFLLPPMQRLIAFGDSWTHGHGVEHQPPLVETSLIGDLVFSLRLCNSWPRWLSDRFGMPCANIGHPGASNEQIFHKIRSCANEFSSEDLIIVMWSFPYRLPNLKEFVPRRPHEVVREAIGLLSDFNYYFVNAFYPMFQHEQHRIQDLDLSRFLDMDRSAADVLREYERDNDVSVWEYGKRITDLRDQELGEGLYHPNLLGYQVIADWLYDILPPGTKTNGTKTISPIGTK